MFDLLILLFIIFIKVEGFETQFFGLPVELGREGVAHIHPLPQLSASEQEQLKQLIPVLRGNIDTGVNFVKG